MEINCKEIFQNAYEKRYTWNPDFKGYKGKCTYLFDKILMKVSSY